MIALLIKKLFTQYQQCLDQVSDLEKQQLLSKPKVWFFLFGKSMNFDDISTLKCLINFFILYSFNLLSMFDANLLTLFNKNDEYI